MNVNSLRRQDDAVMTLLQKELFATNFTKYFAGSREEIRVDS